MVHFRDNYLLNIVQISIQSILIDVSTLPDTLKILVDAFHFDFYGTNSENNGENNLIQVFLYSFELGPC